jgi:hypothetical protein
MFFVVGATTVTVADLAISAPITYTFSGTATGTLGSTPFTTAEVTIHTGGDTSTVGALSFGSTYCNDLTNAIVTVSGVGTAAITDQLLNFDNPLTQALGLTLGTCASPINDWLDIANPQFATYDLRGPIGPVISIGSTTTLFRPINTNRGLLYFVGSTFRFQAAEPSANPLPTLSNFPLVVRSILLAVLARGLVVPLTRSSGGG